MYKAIPIQKIDDKIKLSRPIKNGDKELTELVLDFDSLTGRDLIEAEKEGLDVAPPANISEMSKGYLTAVAARAARVRIDTILDLSALDYSIVTMTVQSFLFGIASPARQK